MTELAAELLDILACPRCRGALVPEPAALRCDACGVRYPVIDGIPHMLLSDATATHEDAENS